MILQNSSTIPGQKALFSKFEEFSRTKVKFFQVCAISVRASLILYAILTHKFTLWIYVVVMECRSLFSSTSWESVLEKMHPQQIAYFIYGSIPYLLCRYILDPGESPNVSKVTVTLTSGFSSSKVELRAYLYII